MAKGYDNEDQAAEAALREAARLKEAAVQPPLASWERPMPKGSPGSRFFIDEQLAARRPEKGTTDADE